MCPSCAYLMPINVHNSLDAIDECCVAAPSDTVSLLSGAAVSSSSLLRRRPQSFDERDALISNKSAGCTLHSNFKLLTWFELFCVGP